MLVRGSKPEVSLYLKAGLEDEELLLQLAVHVRACGPKLFSKQHVHRGPEHQPLDRLKQVSLRSWVCDATLSVAAFLLVFSV